ncbi:MAG TPA: type II toxin-antitoxin system VapC family toxin [Thermoanaerobaculia bacterium]|nr:type II toxin-antitoxin system VapC family toxin [Thermoanaerobaculia bacterium]
MILPDINLLVYAYNSDAPAHRRAKAWWESCLSQERPVALPWSVMLGYLRLMTNRKVVVDPFSALEAIRHIRSWLERPQVQILQPGPRHLDLLDSLMRDAHAAGSLTTDVHLAALAIEHQAELHSNDADFARFPGLRWTDPLR